MGLLDDFYLWVCQNIMDDRDRSSSSNAKQVFWCKLVLWGLLTR